MAEWWQSPRYLERQAAGEVVTPGLVDFGGLVNAFNAPYNDRVGRLPDGPMPPRSGNTVTAYYNAGDGGPVAAKSARARASDPLQSRYVAEPRFVAAMRPPSSPPTQAQMQAMRNIPGSIPADTYTPSIRTAQSTPQRLPASAAGYGPLPPANPAVTAIEQVAPTGPMFPLQMPGKGTPFKGNYTASMRFASPNAGAPGSDVIDLTVINPRNPQAMADSQGKPVRVGQSVYYPGGKGPVGAPQSRNAPATQQRSGGLGGLLGSIFGGGNLGGGRAALESGWTAARSSIGNSPDQGKAMTVNPGTASGSVLSGMGFSDGALVPAATVRNLESRGYFK